jgi:pyridoxine 5-phosphate synthase
MTSRPRSPTALSVNLNKVALVRNTRHLGLPSVTRAATLCLEAGAQGITVHPRPDARHIRSHDVTDLAVLMRQWPDREFNVEGNPFQNLMTVVRDLHAQGLPLHQVTFVPDGEDQFTSDHGWNFPADAARLQPLIAECHSLGVRVSLFMDPDPVAMPAARAVGADRVELYTESYATAYTSANASYSGNDRANDSAPGSPSHAAVLAQFTAAAAAAQAAGLGVNAGHDLSRDNLRAFLEAVPGVQEVSIGHALIADALELGYAATIQAYLACIPGRVATAT